MTDAYNIRYNATDGEWKKNDFLSYS